jgi:hypothetical protein
MKSRCRLGRLGPIALAVAMPQLLVAQQGSAGPDFNDSHFHLTNYVQKGPDPRDVLRIMGTRVGRSTLFGIPLQQTWASHNSGGYAPEYYLQTDAPLYYYSFTDAYIASVFRSLSPEEKARFDPMITGFNPADMYAVDHIRRVLEAFPGVFEGIGEFTIHKEFVSSKVAGETASLTDPALDSIFAFAERVGLVVLIHSDMDMPFGKPGAEPVYLSQMTALLKRHPGTTVVWAHIGLGRVVHPVQSGGSSSTTERSPGHVEITERLLADPQLRNLHFDISWDEVAKYLVASPQTVERAASVINRYPDRFLFGTDNVAPAHAEQYFAVFEQYAPLWRALTPEASRAVRLGNYERIFDTARHRVREWERTNLKGEN